MRIRSRRGFTLVEVLIVVAVIALLGAMAVPALQRARMAGHEAAAVARLSAINSSQSTYAATCTSGTFALTLDVLGRAPSGGGTPFISPDMSAGPVVKQDGYEFSMSGDHAPPSTATNCQGLVGGEGQATGYWAVATAVSSSTGRRDFWTNTSRAVWQVPSNGDGRSAFRASNSAGPPDPMPGGGRLIETGTSGSEAAPVEVPTGGGGKARGPGSQP